MFAYIEIFRGAHSVPIGIFLIEYMYMSHSSSPLRKIRVLTGAIGICAIALTACPEPLPGNFYRHTNGVTVICDDAEIGESGVVGGVTYTRRASDDITADNAATACTSGITDMNSIFSGASEFNGDIATWDTSSVVYMDKMFMNAHTFNQDIGNWNTAAVIDMGGMFMNASAFQPRH